MVAVQWGRLVARNTHTSVLASLFGDRPVWVFGDRMGERSYRNDDGQWQQEEGLVFANGGRVFTYSQIGTLFAVSATTGKRLWSSPMRLPLYTVRSRYGIWRTPNVQAMTGDGTTLAVAANKSIAVFDARTGHQRWRSARRDEFGGIMAVYVMPHVVLRTRYVEGAGMHEETDAFDKMSGRLLWSADGTVNSEKSHSGLIDLEESYLGESADHPNRWHHHRVAEKTGKVLKEYLTE